MRSKFGWKFELSLFDLENCQVAPNSLSSRSAKGMLDLWSQAVDLDLLGKVQVSWLRTSETKVEAIVSPRKVVFPVCYAALSLDPR